MSVVHNGSVNLHYEVIGAGPTLVLHTGAGGDSRIWRDAGYLPGLAEFRVVLMDQRGRGQSDRPARVEDHAIERYVEDVGCVLDAVGAESAGFWGYSNGFLVGLAFGAAFPRRLDALVGTGAVPVIDLTDLPAITDRASFIAQVVAEGGVRGELDEFMRTEHDRFPERIDQNVRETDPFMGALRRVAWRAWRGPHSVIPTVRAPVLVLAGEKESRDGVTGSAVARFPHGRLVQLPGEGHLSAFYRSDLALAHALPFLREHLGATAGSTAEPASFPPDRQGK